MTTFETIEAKPYHCGAMTRMLRLEHRKAVTTTGFNIHRELAQRFNESSFRRAWMINGNLAALGGVTGSLMDPAGQIWLAVSQRALDHPVAMVREARRQMEEIMQTKHELVTMVLGGDETAKRFAIFLGFLPSSGPLRTAETKQGRKLSADYLDAPEHRMVIGDGYGIPLRYQRELAEV